MSHRKPVEPVEGNPYRIRDPQAAALVEISLISAVVTILVIRGYLHLTGYPQVGGETLHIAHIVWGGLGMVIGFGMLMLFAHHVWKPIAAVVSGAGFGAFVDETGKFITQDNDYFFEPAIAIIYAVVIVLFGLARYFGRKREPTEADHLYLVAQGLQWQAIGKLDADRQKVALEHLELSGNTTPMADQMRSMLESARLVEDSEQSRILEWRRRMVDRYWEIVESRWLMRIVLAVFTLKVIQIIGTFALGRASDSFLVGDGLSVVEWGAVIAAVSSGGLAILGLVRLQGGRRVSALHAFAASVVFSLLFGQFFAFESNQFLAFANLIVELVVFGLLRFALSAESRAHDEQGSPQDRLDPESGIGALF